MPLVSIVLPTYNRAHLIRSSLDSCLQQTFQDFELIIVNDNSTDETAAILEEYQLRDDRIKVIYNEKNLKIPGSLNKGFAAASGKYFTWTSDDNRYAKNALQVLAATLEENPGVDLVYANYKEIDRNDNVTGIAVMNDINKSVMLWKGCGSCFMYKAEIHRSNGGYDTTLFLIEDYDFFLRASLKFKFLYLERSDLYNHRHHSESLTSVQGHAVFELQKIIVERKQMTLIPTFSDYDKMLFYRKYAVYYAVLKNNIQKANYYLNMLSKTNKKNYWITIFYIIGQKITSTFTVTFGIIKGGLTAQK